MKVPSESIPKTIKIIIKCESELALKIFINFFNIFIDCPKGRKKITAELYYSTVTLFAKLRGWSTSVSLSTAT